MTSETIVPQVHREGQHLRSAVAASALAALDRLDAVLAREQARYGLDARPTPDPLGAPTIDPGRFDREATRALQAAARERWAMEGDLCAREAAATPLVAAIAREERALADERSAWLYPALGGLLGTAALAEVARGAEREAVAVIAASLAHRRAAIARARATLALAPESAWALAGLVEDAARARGTSPRDLHAARARGRLEALGGPGATLAAAFAAATAGAR